MSGKAKTAIQTTFDPSVPLRSVLQEMVLDKILEGMCQDEAYFTTYPRCKSIETARASSSRLLTVGNVKARLDYKRAEIERESGIDIVYCRQRLLKLADAAEKKGKEGTARACVSDLIKTIGGFKADEPSDKSIELKLIDAEARREVAKALQGYYDGKYLASSSR